MVLYYRTVLLSVCGSLGGLQESFTLAVGEKVSSILCDISKNTDKRAVVRFSSKRGEVEKLTSLHFNLL